MASNTDRGLGGREVMSGPKNPRGWLAMYGNLHFEDFLQNYGKQLIRRYGGDWLVNLFKDLIQISGAETGNPKMLLPHDLRDFFLEKIRDEGVSGFSAHFARSQYSKAFRDLPNDLQNDIHNAFQLLRSIIEHSEVITEEETTDPVEIMHQIGGRVDEALQGIEGRETSLPPRPSPGVKDVGRLVGISGKSPAAPKYPSHVDTKNINRAMAIQYGCSESFRQFFEQRATQEEKDAVKNLPAVFRDYVSGIQSTPRVFVIFMAKCLSQWENEFRENIRNYSIADADAIFQKVQEASRLYRTLTPKPRMRISLPPDIATRATLIIDGTREILRQRVLYLLLGAGILAGASILFIGDTAVLSPTPDKKSVAKVSPSPIALAKRRGTRTSAPVTPPDALNFPAPSSPNPPAEAHRESMTPEKTESPSTAFAKTKAPPAPAGPLKRLKREVPLPHKRTTIARESETPPVVSEETDRREIPSPLSLINVRIYSFPDGSFRVGYTTTPLTVTDVRLIVEQIIQHRDRNEIQAHVRARCRGKLCRTSSFTVETDRLIPLLPLQEIR